MFKLIKFQFYIAYTKIQPIWNANAENQTRHKIGHQIRKRKFIKAYLNKGNL